ncbi:MAG: radical SAM protein [Elusimicrobiota bacterium]
MRRLDLKIGFACNNRCDFCAQGDKRRSVARLTFRQIVGELKTAAQQGVRGVVFTGGEPTLHPHLLEAVAAAKTLGYRSIQVQTNGRRFAYLDFCRALKEAGANEFSPSLHGSTPAVHDGQTHSPGAWKQVVRGIENMRRLGLFVLTNSVVTRRNYKDLPELARLLVRLEVDQMQFAFVHIVGTAAVKAREVVPRKSDAMPYIKEGLRVGRAGGVRCYTEAIPYCLLAGFDDCAAERVIPDGIIVDSNIRVEHWERYRTQEGKAKRRECGTCRYDAVCEGPWREYPEMYGWDEFAPVAEAPVA